MKFRGAECLASCGHQTETMAIAKPVQFGLDKNQSLDSSVAFVGNESRGVVSSKSRPGRGLYFEAAGKSIQHPLKKLSGRAARNADAFVCTESLLGVADGVSSVEQEGFDSSRLPIELLQRSLLLYEFRMANSELFDKQSTQFRDLLSDPSLPEFFPDWPCDVLSRASAECREFGSTTVCLAFLEKETSMVKSANIGDSQILILRRTDETPVSLHQIHKRQSTKMRRRRSFSHNEDLIRLSPKTTHTRRVVERFRSPAAAKVAMKISSALEDMDDGHLVDTSDNTWSLFDDEADQLFPPAASRRIKGLESEEKEEAVRKRFPEIPSIGGYSIIGRSQTQQHSFNCPFQVSRMQDMSVSAEEMLRRTFWSTAVCVHPVKEGDIVLVGSDGVIDNLYDEDIVEMVNRSCWMEKEKLPQGTPDTLAEMLVDAAIVQAYPSPNVCHTPFAVAARIEVSKIVMGGKPDDTSVVVAFVKSQ